MRFFVLGLALLVPLTSSAKSPCRPPPNQATSVVSEGRAETRSDTVVFTQADYARLYEFYSRCLLAKSGTASDWQLFLRRADEAERAATINLEHQPLLDHLREIEATRLGVKAAVADSNTVVAQLHELEAIVAELQAQINRLSAPSQPVTASSEPQTAALAEAK